MSARLSQTIKHLQRPSEPVMSVVADNELKGRLALITGASGGIGGAIARDLYQNGCDLALTYSTNRGAIDDLIKSLEASSFTSSQKLSFYRVDMSSADAIAELFIQVEKDHGHGPDILISNAGHGKRIPQIVDIALEEWDYTLAINLRAAFILCKLAVPHMASQKWGRIVLMSSIAAYGGGINGCHYAASKAGLGGMCKNLAMRLAKDGITVNDVAPAMIGETGMIPDAKYVEGTPGDVKNIPVGRLGIPQEVANVATMFCRTGYMTGQSVLVAGGWRGSR